MRPVAAASEEVSEGWTEVCRLESTEETDLYRWVGRGANRGVALDRGGQIEWRGVGVEELSRVRLSNTHEEGGEEMLLGGGGEGDAV